MLDLKNALLNQFRKRLTDPVGRGTAKTDTFSGDNSTTDFTLTQYPLMYIDSVTVGSTNNRLLRDYKIDFGTSKIAGKIKFTTAPTTGSDNITVVYRYGSNWVYPGSPHTTAEMPRVGIRQIGGGEKSGGVGDLVVFLNPVFKFGVWVRVGKSYTISGETYTGDKLVDYIATDIQNQARNIRDGSDIDGNITIRIDSLGTDIDFDKTLGLNRREMNVYVMYEKSY